MRYLVTLLGLLCSLSPAAADDQAATNRTKAISDHWLQVSRTNAESFRLAPAKAGSAPYRLYEKPIFRHTQSVRGDDIGAVHLWIKEDGRPAVVGVVFAWTNSKTTRMGSYEFHSLTSEPVQLTDRERIVWTSKRPGVSWQVFSQATLAPPPTKLQQRLQANKMARKFTANTTSGEEQKWELRRAPTPIYQYAARTAGVTHGAMYAFCQGTDTEVILLIEAATKNGGPATETSQLDWRYALVPFTDYKARVNYEGQQIWESPPGELSQDGQPHFWAIFGAIPKPDFEIRPE